MDEWMNEQTVGYHIPQKYSTLSKNEILPYETMCMKLEKFMLPHKKTNILWFHL